MGVTVELTYEMSKELGENRFEVDAADVADVVEATRERFGAKARGVRRAPHPPAVAVNGVLVRHRRAMQARASADGDRVSFVKAAAGG